MSNTSELDTSITLAALASLLPAGIPVLEEQGLDYCCGGDRTLEDACKSRDIDPVSVIDAMRQRQEHTQPGELTDWTNASMTELSEHIETTHHAFVRESLTRLGDMMPKLIKEHGQSHPELEKLAEIIEVFGDDMRDHMVREERVLFPWLRRLEKKTEIQSGPPWSVKRPISCMVHDHDDAGEQLRTMRSLTNDFSPPVDACGTYREMLRTLGQLEADTHVHIHKENNILFPAGIEAEAALPKSRHPTSSRP
ncbi:MAG: iron-sulfur cluster repair di-iron protein [Phycisphaerales bacterium]|nr:iron-sulfur cluster repair di-iron protein [Phycisphaerales bacterium]